MTRHDRRDDARIGIDLQVPAEPRDAFGDRRQHPLDRGDIRYARRHEVQAHATHAQRVHLVERRVGNVRVDYRDAAQACRLLAQRVEQAAIVAPVRTRLHQHNARKAQAAGNARVLRQRLRRRRVLPRGRARIACRRAQHVHVAVAGERRNLHLFDGRDLGVLDHLRPAHVLGPDELGQLLRRAG